MKRIVSLLLVVIMAAALVPACILSASADGAAEITLAVSDNVKYTKVNPMDVFTATIDTKNVSEIAGFKVTVSWDPRAVEYVGYTTSKTVTNSSTKSTTYQLNADIQTVLDAEKGTIKFVVASAKAITYTTTVKEKDKKDVVTTATYASNDILPLLVLSFKTLTGDNSSINLDASLSSSKALIALANDGKATAQTNVTAFAPRMYTVNDYAFLSDGKTGYTAWKADQANTNNSLLLSCKNNDDDRIYGLQFNLNSVEPVNSVSLDMFQGDADIGYPTGKASIYTSVDGLNYTSVGDFDFTAKPNPAKAGTVKSTFSFEPTDAKFVIVYFFAEKGTAHVCVSEATTSSHTHKYEEVITPASFDKDGKKETKCECGDVTKTEVIKAVGIPQPETKVEVPAGATAIDVAGYKHVGGISVILAGDGKTVAELTKLGCAAEKDLAWWVAYTVDANGVVTAVLPGDGTDKKAVVCPEGGYILAFHADAAVKPELKVGDVITLYNIDLKKINGTAGNIELKDAAFTVGEAGLLGDVDGNGEVNFRDYIALKRAIVNNTTNTLKNADVDGNGEINFRDYIALKRMIINK